MRTHYEAHHYVVFSNILLLGNILCSRKSYGRPGRGGWSEKCRKLFFLIF